MQLGRFHQIDELADQLLSLNPYQFSFNNPINLNDPTGLYPNFETRDFDKDPTFDPVKEGKKYLHNGEWAVCPSCPNTSEYDIYRNNKELFTYDSETGIVVNGDGSGVTVRPDSEDDSEGGVGAPGFRESLIPVWGSGRSAVNDFQNGRIGWGLFNTGMAISDVFLVKSIGTAVVKGVVKIGGSFSWQATRSWYVNSARYGPLAGFQPVHHWLIPRNGWGRAIPNAVKNQPYNLLPASQALYNRILPLTPNLTQQQRWITVHNLIEGKATRIAPGLGQLNLGERLWFGTPEWIKGLIGGTPGDVVNQTFNQE
jgi:hypothetical protein